MPTFVEVLPATKSEPHPGILWTPGAYPGTGKLTIQGKRTPTTHYAVAEFPTEWAGTAAKLVKFVDTPGQDRESESYEVYVGKPHDQCSCKGFAYGRGKPCRHIEALKAIVANNWLDRSAMENGERDVSNTEVHDQSAPHPADLQGGF